MKLMDKQVTDGDEKQMRSNRSLKVAASPTFPH